MLFMQDFEDEEVAGGILVVDLSDIAHFFL